MRGFKEIVTVSCDCGHEKICIEVEEPEENGFPPIDECAHVSLWTQENMDDGDFGNKARHILKILKDGHPYSDQLLVNVSDCRKLGEAFLKAADVIEENKKEEQKKNVEAAKSKVDSEGWVHGEGGLKWKAVDADKDLLFVSVRTARGDVSRVIIPKSSIKTLD